MIEYIQNSQMKCVEPQSAPEEIYHLFASGREPVVFVTSGGRFLGALERDSFLRADPKIIAENGWQAQIDAAYPTLQANGDGAEACKAAAIALLMKNKALQLIPVLSSDKKIEYGFRRMAKDRNTEELQLTYQYALLLQAGYSIGDSLRVRNIHTVSIYGTDKLALLLYNDLASYPGIEVRWIIDHRQVKIGDVYSTLWKDLTPEILNSTQLLIVTYIHIFEELSTHTRKRGFRTVLSMQELVQQLYDYAYEIKPMIDKLLELQGRGISILYAHFPTISEVANPSPREKQILSQKISSVAIRKSFETYQDVVLQAAMPWYTKEEMQKLYLTPIPVAHKNESMVNVDLCTPLYQIVNGLRVTTDCPQTPAEHNVCFFGKSWTFGLCVKDAHTIESYFQRKLNHSSQTNYKVINYGMNGISLRQVLDKINGTVLKPGDVLFLIFNHKEFERQYQLAGLPYCDLTPCVKRPHTNGELYVDTVHVNPKGNELMADALYSAMFEKKSSHSCQGGSSSFHYYGIREKPVALRILTCENTMENNPQLLDYISRIKKQRAAVSGKIGSIVMNCNPFTNGHRYLIETAASQVDYLYLFVVEEDKSVFPFRDRFELVKKGTADLPNVTVLPSGKFIISSITFPGYFVKGEKNDAVVDTSQDLTLFAQKIAPALGITIRFAGNEPTDNITRQYNEQMAKLLPRYGMQFIEIPRKEANGRPISASTVRALLKDKKLEELKQIVPPSTFAYLVEHPIKLHNSTQ